MNLVKETGSPPLITDEIQVEWNILDLLNLMQFAVEAHAKPEFREYVQAERDELLKGCLRLTKALTAPESTETGRPRLQLLRGGAS